MAEGTNTWEGGAVPLQGESEITQQTAATDILTLTGAASQSGDFVVFQDSSGTELFVVSASGALTTTRSPSLGISSTSQGGAATIAVTSTGAIAAGATLANGLLVSMSSKSVLNAVIGYNSGGGSEVGTAEAFFAVHGSKAPTYFVSVGATAAGVGAPGDNGFVETGLTFNAAPSTTNAFYGLNMLAGSKSVYLLACPASLFTVA